MQPVGEEHPHHLCSEREHNKLTGSPRVDFGRVKPWFVVGTLGEGVSIA